MQSGDRKTQYRHVPVADTVLRSREEAERELNMPCGRFKTPRSIEDNLALFISDRLRTLDPLAHDQLFAGSAIPLNWQRLLSYLHRSGVIREPAFHYPRTASDRPKVLNLGLLLNKKSRPTDGHTRGYGAYGTGERLEEAMSKTIGEALERYFFSIYTRDSLLTSSYNELLRKKRSALDISKLNRFLPSQVERFPQFAVDGDTELTWVEASHFANGKKILVPAQLVYWNFQHENVASGVRHEHVLARSTTSGCAGHFTRDEAVLSALLELIERDGFLIFWLNRISPPLLDVSSMTDTSVVELLAYLRRYRFDVQFVNTTTDIGIPSVTCVLTDVSEPENPKISIGACAGFDLPRMLVHSATEALLVSTYVSLQPESALPDPYTPFSDPSIDRTTRLTMWHGKKMRDAFSFFTSGKKQRAEDMMRTIEQPADTKAALSTVLKQLGDDVIVYDMKDPVLTELGFHAVRTIVPHLVPLYLVEHTALLDSRRLRDVPDTLRYRAAKTYNPLPHPFP